MVWQVNGTPDTLAAPADVLAVSDLLGLQFNEFLLHEFASTDFPFIRLTINDDSTTSYAARKSFNGGGDTFFTNSSDLRLDPNSGKNNFVVIDLIAISGEEVLFISNLLNNGSGNGAGNAPEREELYGKYIGSSVASSIEIRNSNTGDYDINSNLSAFGTD